MHEFSELHAPVQKLDTIKGVELWVKRDDLIHAAVSGNKWRKLKYYLADFRKTNKTSILTFGGAFSNHLAATAALGKMAGIPTRALVRGEEVQRNATLDFCRAQDMEVESISRKCYSTKDDPEFLRLLETELPEVYVIPEGGKGALGMHGCTEILGEVDKSFDYIAVSAGTGTTAAGMLMHSACKKLLCFSSLKGGHFLQQAIKRQLLAYQLHFSTNLDEEKLLEERLLLEENYHFGGYGKVQPELIQFMNDFYQNYQLALDPIYTGKLFFGLLDKIRQGFLPTGTKVLAIHTGGLQGVNGMNERLIKKGLKIDYAI